MEKQSNLSLAQNLNLKYLGTQQEQKKPYLGFLGFTNIFLWILFFASLLLLIFKGNIPNYDFDGWFRINGFTLIIWATVTFFSAIVNTYSRSYLIGFKYHQRFVKLSLGFTFSVMLFVASNHVALFILSWFTMGFFMAKLIGVNKEWKDAKEAAKFSHKYFLIGTLFLAAGTLLLAFKCQSLFLSDIIGRLGNLSILNLTLSAIFIIVAAIIQSAIYPFHRWLLSAMTAPTPASALMHAGFVNGSGILLAIFSSLIFHSQTFTLLLIIGGLTAIIAQFTKLLQVNVKQKLACSTIAQMGFMIMQCGLGFFNAAVAHLILHGFYKAYLFLSSGETVEHTKPKNNQQIVIKPMQAVIVLIYGLIGAWLFATLTGKGTALNSGIFLTLIVAITVGQVTYNIVKQKNLSLIQKAFIPPMLFFIGIGLYAAIYSGVTYMMSGMPFSDTPLPLSFIQIGFGIIFLVGFFIMKLGGYQKVPWLYVKLLNLSQPYHKTTLNFNNK
ncbi:pesticidal protein Cry28Aa [Pedobacter sp. SD-b]|uniref:Pesticidal protein Cry28Aa n=1 Tax=Pedobacter segetis TaxID=2793069 RepID=A0ABS1BKX4_9SPHI|nr:proton-conducting transporter membrane subunit [Pedobacter segetis]MBK0383453.1 pesticidal protein Cry28Aa [Pedobacter segetis]